MILTQEVDVNEFNELKVILEEDSGEHLEMWEDMRRIFIDGSEAQLMLRLNYNVKTLVIARILVRSQHRGVGTKVLNWLKDYAKRNNYEFIMIESTTTPEINRFAEKYGFKVIEEQCFSYCGEKYGNYLLKL